MILLYYCLLFILAVLMASLAHAPEDRVLISVAVIAGSWLSACCYPKDKRASERKEKGTE